MKPSVVYLLLILTLFSCDAHKYQTDVLTKAEETIDCDLAKAKSYLDEIANPMELSEKEFALYTYLSCRIADSLHADLPLHAEIDRATKWYEQHRDELVTTRMLLFRGRSSEYYEEGYKAMDSYLKALDKADKNKFYNEAGYISSYMGDLYSNSGDELGAASKYNEAAKYFGLARNFQSQAYAYRDLGRSWALVDSLDLAMEYFDKAEKIAVSIRSDRALSSILNGKGNIYRMRGEHALAEKFLQASLRVDSIGSIPTMNALINIYLERGDLAKAGQLLDSLSGLSLNEEYATALNYRYYLFYDRQGDAGKALDCLKKVYDYYQTTFDKDNKSTFHELEKKYNNVILISQLDKMRMQTQYYVIFLIILLVAVLVLVTIYQYRMIRSKRRIEEQDKEIQSLMAKYYFITNELKDKEEIISATYEQKEKEVRLLSEKLKELRRKRLLNSDIGKKIKKIASTVKPKSDRSLITVKMWSAIEKEIKDVYPEFELKIAELYHQELSESEWQYCCLVLFDLDSNEEGILLNINPHSARTRKTRIRRKLGIELKEQTLYKYFVDNLLNF